MSLLSFSYIFHLTFGSTFTLLLNGSRLVLTGSADREKTSDNYFLEFVCVILTGEWFSQYHSNTPTHCECISTQSKLVSRSLFTFVTRAYIIDTQVL